MSIEGGEGREQDHQPKQIEAPQEEGLVSREQIDLDTARAILQAIVDTHESTITEETSLDQVQVAGKIYDMEQVRKAERMVAESFIKETGKSRLLSRSLSATKSTSQGELHFELNNDGIYAQLNLPLEHSLSNYFPLTDQNEGFDVSLVGFHDERLGRKGEFFLKDLQKHEYEIQLTKLQIRRGIWRGLRWTNANMLAWESHAAVLPEQLDTISGSSSQDSP